MRADLTDSLRLLDRLQAAKASAHEVESGLGRSM